ncbi:MAG TPA: fumarylacetoacetate hydrolase family protein, partial [Burkholderiales bacterium]|nr:fumarylacetoacetate hydrolase family protein [Burkholderiales bacterium]
MKLLRYGPLGGEKPGMLDRQGKLRDLSGVVKDIDRAVIGPAGLAKLRAIDPETLPLVKGEPRFGVPVAEVSKFIAVGLNYLDHAKESGMPIPTEPILFSKAVSCLNGPNDDIIQPKNSTKLDWEVELGIIIGTKAQYVTEAKALEHVAGYCTVNDMSERNFQLERGSQWDRGKGCDTFGPVGPYLVTTDEIANPQTLDLWLAVNGTRRQTGNTKNMIFNCATLVSYISHFMTLMPGDIITTGTPPG